MNAQEIYNTVRDHLLAQNEKAVRPGTSSCVYRAPGGKKCAAGCLIADEHYNPAMEGSSVPFPGMSEWEHDRRHDLISKALTASGISPEDFALVAELQDVHDCYYPEVWPEKLAEVANDFGLTP